MAVLAMGGDEFPRLEQTSYDLAAARPENLRAEIGLMRAITASSFLRRKPFSSSRGSWSGVRSGLGAERL